MRWSRWQCNVRIIAGLALHAMLPPNEAIAYRPDLAVHHAHSFWSREITGYDPRYNDYHAENWEVILGFLLPGVEARYGDCANFASQNLIVGGLDISAGPGVDDKGAIPIVQNLAIHLTSKQHAKPVAQIDYRVTKTAPPWLAPGDIVTWGDSDRPFRHSGTVTGGLGNSAVVTYHSTDRKDVAWSFPAEKDNNKWFINFYHIDSKNPSIRLRKKSNRAEITPGGFSDGSAVIVEATDDADGSGIASINIKHVQTDGIGVASHINSTRTFTGNSLTEAAEFPDAAFGESFEFADGETYLVTVKDVTNNESLVTFTIKEPPRVTLQDTQGQLWTNFSGVASDRRVTMLRHAGLPDASGLPPVEGTLSFRVESPRPVTVALTGPSAGVPVYRTADGVTTGTVSLDKRGDHQLTFRDSAGLETSLPLRAASLGLFRCAGATSAYNAVTKTFTTSNALCVEASEGLAWYQEVSHPAGEPLSERVEVAGNEASIPSSLSVKVGDTTDALKSFKISDQWSRLTQAPAVGRPWGVSLGALGSGADVLETGAVDLLATDPPILAGAVLGLQSDGSLMTEPYVSFTSEGTTFTTPRDASANQELGTYNVTLLTGDDMSSAVSKPAGRGRVLYDPAAGNLVVENTNQNPTAERYAKLRVEFTPNAQGGSYVLCGHALVSGTCNFGTLVTAKVLALGGWISGHGLWVGSALPPSLAMSEGPAETLKLGNGVELILPKHGSGAITYGIIPAEAINPLVKTVGSSHLLSIQGRLEGPVGVKIPYETAGLSVSQKADAKLFVKGAGYVGAVDLTTERGEGYVVAQATPSSVATGIHLTVGVPLHENVATVTDEGLLFQSNEPVTKEPVAPTAPEITRTLAVMRSQGWAPVPPIYLLGPTGQTFSPPARMEMTFDRAAVSAAGLDPDAVRLFQFSADGEFQNVTIETRPDRVYGEVTAFSSYFAVFGSTTPQDGPDLQAPFTDPEFVGVVNRAASPIQISTATRFGLVARDPPEPGFIASGVKESFVQVDGGPFNLFTQPFTLPLGVHDVSFYSTDNAGNSESPQTLRLEVLANWTARTPGPTTVLSRSSQTLSLAWDANGNSEGTLYVVRSGVVASQSCAEVPAVSRETLSLSTAAVLPGLAPQTNYHVTVCNPAAEVQCNSPLIVATGSAGEEPAPPILDCSAPPPVPPAPQGGLAVAADGAGRLWEVYDGGEGLRLGRFSGSGAPELSTALPGANGEARWTLNLDGAGNVYAVGTATTAAGRVRITAYKVSADAVLLETASAEEQLDADSIALDSTGGIWITGAVATGVGTPSEQVKLGLWRYVPGTASIALMGEYQRGGGLDAGAAVRVVGDSVWVAGFSAAAGASDLDMAVWKFSLTGSLVAGPYVIPGYFGALPPVEAAQVRLEVADGRLYAAATKAVGADSADLGFLILDLEGNVTLERRWHHEAGGASQPLALVKAGDGSLVVAGAIYQNELETAAVWRYSPAGDLLSAQSSMDDIGVARDAALAGAEIWLAASKSTMPVRFNGQPVAGTDVLVSSSGPAPPSVPLAVTGITPNQGVNNASLEVTVAGAGFQSGASLALTRGPASAWTAAGALAQPRSTHEAHRLADGKVIVIGGGLGNTSPTATAELFDPATRSWSPAASMSAGRYALSTAKLADGRILAAGGWYGPETAELYDPATDSWSPAGSLPGRRRGAMLVALRNGKALLAGGVVDDNTAYLNEAFLYDPAVNAWTPAAPMAQRRGDGRAVLLADGRVMVTGGYQVDRNQIDVELFDPETASWTLAAPMPRARYGHSATLLADGRVLVAGGADNGYLDTAVIYDPAADSWTAAPPMPGIRAFHRAALLPDGKVLLAGGFDGSRAVATTALYDPAANVWTSGPSLAAERADATVTVLADGSALVAGGWSNGPAPANAELLPARTIVASGVSMAGSTSLSGALDLAGQATGFWTVVVTNPDGRQAALINGFQIAPADVAAPVTTLTLSPVPFIDAQGRVFLSSAASVALTAADDLSGAAAVYYKIDPSTAVLAAGLTAATTGAFELYSAPFGLAEGARLIAYGARDVAGNFETLLSTQVGVDSTPPVVSLSSAGRVVSLSAEDPVVAGAASGLESLSYVVDVEPSSCPDAAADPSAAPGTCRNRVYAGPFALPPGDHVVYAYASDRVGNSGAVTAFSISIPQPAAPPSVASITPSEAANDGTATVTVTGDGFQSGASLALTRGLGAAWTSAGALAQGRFTHTAHRLRDGKVLVVGGGLANTSPAAASEAFDPATRAWSARASMSAGRYALSSTELSDGRILAAGGWYGPETTEIYDPAADAWTPAGSLPGRRRGAMLVTLADGKALLAGGVVDDNTDYLNEAFLYDPASNAWTPAAPMAQRRGDGRAVVLADGRVLVTGGYQLERNQIEVEVYDPSTGAWSLVAPMPWARYGHSATRLADGRVLVAGGANDGYFATAAIYDPASDGWTSIASLPGPRAFHRAVLLPDGRVLLAGGFDGAAALASTAIFDPAAGIWTSGPSLAVARADATVTLLADGSVLVAGGWGDGPAPAGAELLPAGTLAATGVVVEGPTGLTGTLDLAGQATGYWNVLVVNPDGQSGLLAGGFRVLPPPIQTVSAGELGITSATLTIEAVGASSLSITTFSQAGLPPAVQLALSSAGLDAIGAVFDVLPEGTVFEPPARFTMSWRDADNDGFEDTTGAAESSIVLRRYHNGDWLEVAPVLVRDEAANLITVEIPVLASMFALTIPHVEPPPRDLFTARFEPRVLNLASRGETVKLTLRSAARKVSEIAPASVRLVRVNDALLASPIPALVKPEKGKRKGKEDDDEDEDEEDEDGGKLELRFGRQAVAAVLPAGEQVQLLFAGVLADGAEFEVPAFVRTIRPVKVPKGKPTTVAHVESKAMVSLPAGALAADLDVTVTKLAKQEREEEDKQKRAADAGGLKPLGELYDFGPDGTRFAEPVTLTLPYDPAAAGDPSRLKIAYWNPARAAWEELESSVDTARRVVTARTAHFSQYQVVAPAAGGAGGGGAAAADGAFVLREAFAFPNPARGRVTIRVKAGQADSMDVSVYDVSGRRVHGGSTRGAAVVDGEWTLDHVWDTGGVGSGVYYYSVTVKKAGHGDIRKLGKVGVIK